VLLRRGELPRTAYLLSFDKCVEVAMVGPDAQHLVNHRELRERLALGERLIPLELEPRLLTTAMSRYVHFVTHANNPNLAAG
jgi:hypothetical protein